MSDKDYTYANKCEDEYMSDKTTDNTDWLYKFMYDHKAEIFQGGVQGELIQALAQLIKQHEQQARIDELERILEAGGGADFVNQMANAVGQVGRRYKELKGIEDVS